MTDTDEQLIRTATERYSAGDIDGFLDCFTADVLFHSSPNWPESGTWDREAMREYGRERHEMCEDVKVEVREVRSRGDRIAARCSWTVHGRTSGAGADMDFSILLTVRDGLIATGQFSDEPEGALAAL